MLCLILALYLVGTNADQFIVQVKNTTTPESINLMAKHNNLTIMKQWRFGSFAAYMTDASASVLNSIISEDPSVLGVEPNRKGHIDLQCQAQDSSVWGLNRITHQALESENYCGPTPAAEQQDIDAYVVDTGIRCTHKEFSCGADCSRVLAKEAFSTFPNSNGCNDWHGHGTHVAGTVGGTNFGVAKNVNLIPVQVCDAGGYCSTADIISGVDYTISNAAKKKKRSVANMSLGILFSAALNAAITSAVEEHNIFYAVSAGNDNNQASLKSPASCKSTLTVGSSDQAASGMEQKDIRSDFSNWGKDVDIFAPGSAILSSWGTSDTATNTISGTSMATPMVAGAGALVVTEHPSMSALEVNNKLVDTTQAGSIDMMCGGLLTKSAREECEKTVNLMLQLNFICDNNEC